MQILDRKTAPEIFPINEINFIEPQKSTLSNGIPLFIVNAGSQDVVKIQFLFNAGTIFQSKPLTAFITSKMLTEGTKSHSAHEIADIFDFCGAFIEAEADKDFAVVNLYLLTKYTEQLLSLLEEIVKNPTFPKDELETLMQNKKQEFIVNNEKVSTIARTKFNEIIFGENHPYGKNA
ncbi:MAG: insulinase family protein, partial [Bacteroidetes bacterium]|nr:insulinase family protein [Bacteroidota bacterium]